MISTDSDKARVFVYILRRLFRRLIKRLIDERNETSMGPKAKSIQQVIGEFVVSTALLVSSRARGIYLAHRMTSR